MAAWPSTIPQAPLYGFQEQRQINVATFMPEVGTPKKRRRSTAVCTLCSAVFRMDHADLATFNTFFETTLKDGSLPFTWNHPRTAVSYTWIFEGVPTIEFSEIDHNTVSCRLLRLP